MSKVLVNGLNIRTGPNSKYPVVGQYNKGEIINSGDLIIEDSYERWLRFKNLQGEYRYVCHSFWPDNPQFYVEEAPGIPSKCVDNIQDL